MRFEIENPRKLRNILGLLGVTAAILVGTGEFLLHFDFLARYGGENPYLFMKDISDYRLSAGHFFAVFGVPFYIAGMIHFYMMLRPAGPKLSLVACLVGMYGFFLGAVWIGSRASIGSLAHHPELLSKTSLVALYDLRYETLLQGIRISALLFSILYSYLIWTQKTLYPRWMAFLNTITLILLCFLVFVISKPVGKYVMPIAMNVAYFVMFSLSLFFSMRHVES